MLPVTPSAMAPSAAAPCGQAAMQNAQQATANDTDTDTDPLSIAPSSAVFRSLARACARNESVGKFSSLRARPRRHGVMPASHMDEIVRHGEFGHAHEID